MKIRIEAWQIISQSVKVEVPKNVTDIAKWINENRPTPFLFITSFFDEVTISQAKEFGPKGYIVKPFRDVDIKSNLALAFYTDANKSTPISEDLFIRKEGDVVRLNPDEIIYLKGEDNYTSIFLKNNERIMTSTTLKKMEEKLTAFGFIRIHKSYVVNIKQINGFNGNLVFIGNNTFPIGKAYRKGLMSKITIL